MPTGPRTAAFLVVASAALGCRPEQAPPAKPPEPPAQRVSAEPEPDQAEPEHEFACGSGPIELFEAPHETWDITFSPDGELVAATDADTVAIWDLRSGRRLHTLGGEHPEPIELIAFSPSARRIAALANETLVVWSLDDRQVVRRETLPSRQRRIFYREYEGREWLIFNSAHYPTGTLKPPATAFEVDGGPVFHPFESTVRSSLLALATDTLTLVRGATSAEVWLGPGHELRTLDRAFEPTAISPDGRILISDRRGGVSVWDLQTGVKTGVLSDPDAEAAGQEIAFWPAAIAISPDTKRVAIAYIDERGMLWDRESGATLATIEAPHGVEIMLEFSADGRWLLAGVEGQWDYYDGAEPAHMWLADAQTGEGVSVDLGDYMLSLEWSSDGELLAAAGMSTARLWCRTDLSSPSSAT